MAAARSGVRATMDGFDLSVGGVDWLRILLILAVGFVAWHLIRRLARLAGGSLRVGEIDTEEEKRAATLVRVVRQLLGTVLVRGRADARALRVRRLDHAAAWCGRRRGHRLRPRCADAREGLHSRLRAAVRQPGARRRPRRARRLHGHRRGDRPAHDHAAQRRRRGALRAGQRDQDRHESFLRARVRAARGRRAGRQRRRPGARDPARQRHGAACRPAAGRFAAGRGRGRRRASLDDRHGVPARTAPHAARPGSFGASRMAKAWHWPHWPRPASARKPEPKLRRRRRPATRRGAGTALSRRDTAAGS